MKKTLALASVAFLAASLAGCGGDDNDASGDGGGTTNTDSYCDLLESTNEELANFDFESVGEDQIDSLTSRIDEIEAAAPDDVKDAWATTGGVLTDFQQAISDAGLSMSDLEGLSSGELPEGMDPEALTELGQQLTELTSGGEVEQAQKDIEASAQSECDISNFGEAGAESAPPS